MKPDTKQDPKCLHLSAQATEDFQQIYLLEYKKELTLHEAEILGVNLLKLIKTVYKPIPKKGHHYGG